MASPCLLTHCECVFLYTVGHPKVKAFITHGGSHGIYEGLCNGVPMVMLPLFGDQGDNVQRLVSRGVAESLTIYDLTAEKLLVALRKVINDKRFSLCMKSVYAMMQLFILMPYLILNSEWNILSIDLKKYRSMFYKKMLFLQFRATSFNHSNYILISL